MKMARLMELNRSVIPACDVDSLEALESLVRATGDVTGVGGFKLGFSLAMRYGLPKCVETIRRYSKKPVIYDHQKAGTDIPDTGHAFMSAAKSSGIDSVILFPMSGPAAQAAWIEAGLSAGLNVMVGAEMTHERFLQSDGGFLTNDFPERAFALAARMGVRDFVVPGTKPERISVYRAALEKLLGSGGFDFYSPGFLTQGGDLVAGASAAGKSFHPIVGRAIYNAGSIQAMKTVAQSICDKLAEAP